MRLVAVTFVRISRGAATQSTMRCSVRQGSVCRAIGGEPGSYGRRLSLEALLIEKVSMASCYKCGQRNKRRNSDRLYKCKHCGFAPGVFKITRSGTAPAAKPDKPTSP